MSIVDQCNLIGGLYTNKPTYRRYELVLCLREGDREEYYPCSLRGRDDNVIFLDQRTSCTDA